MIIPAYKKFVQGQPCVWCKRPAPSEQSHVGSHGSAKRGHDEDSCSNCHYCHKRWHGIPVVVNGYRYKPFTEEQKERIRELAKAQYKRWEDDNTQKKI